MDKQKQIEEMAKDMLEYAIDYYPKDMSAFTETKLREQFYLLYLGYAQHLIKAGYRKIHEGTVVLTNDEFWALSNKFSKKELDEIVEFHKKKTRKETAEKFAERLKARFHKSREYYEVDTGTAWSNGHIGGLINDTIDEIAKEITEGKV